jgi:hypothetical protein
LRLVTLLVISLVSLIFVKFPLLENVLSELVSQLSGFGGEFTVAPSITSSLSPRVPIRRTGVWAAVPHPGYPELSKWRINVEE